MRLLLNADEAIAQAALDCGVHLACGYPGTPSTEILECFSELGGHAEWSPNEKVAMEVAIGAAFCHARTLVTMKHVGLNVAADPLFTVTYAGISGGMVIVTADDPGMASSQNEQDNRYYAKAAGCPMLEPADSQEAYNFTRLAFSISEKYNTPVLLRVTTRVCHSKGIVETSERDTNLANTSFEPNISNRVMMPAFARPAHKRLVAKLDVIASWNETAACNKQEISNYKIGIITSGVSYLHAKEVAPNVSILKLGLTYPLPLNLIKNFRNSVERCIVIEEGANYLAESIKASGIEVEQKDKSFIFGELNAEKVYQILSNTLIIPEIEISAGKPPQLCQGCPHRKSFEAFQATDCIVAGDIGCYTLAAMPPLAAMHTQLCMGASIGIGLGMRHTLPENEARRVISVIGDSTFIHSGITGLIEAQYNKPKTGHVIVILDNRITAMTGMQENPATGRHLDHSPAAQLIFEDLIKGIGIKDVHVVDPLLENEKLQNLLLSARQKNEITVIISRRSCILAAKALARREKEA